MAQGSVIKRGNTYSIKYRADGRQRLKAIGPNKKEAERALRDVMSQIDRSEYSDKVIGLSELVDQWLASIQAQVKPSTLEFYTNVGRHLKEHFRDVSVKRIGTAEIESYLAAKIGKLSNKTVGYHLGVSKQLFEKARAWKYISANPCDHLKRPKAENKEIEILSAEQIERLLEVTDGQAQMIILTALHSGLRAGEICALKWDCIDLVEGIIDVRRNYVRGEFTTPKSRGSKRKVIISPLLVDALAKWKDLSAGELVFENNGQPVDWIKFLHGPWSRAIKAAELPKVTPHSLRHSYTSVLLASGEQIAFISKQLGHSDIAITLKVYSHLLPNAEIGAGQRIGRAFENFGIKLVSKPENIEAR